MPTPIPTGPGMGRSLIDHDPRNRDHPARALFGTGLKRRNRTWRRGQAYDQGQTSSCVGQTFKGILNTQLTSETWPYRTRTKFDALEFYRGGQREDEWPGEEPDYQGTSARGVCRYLEHRGFILGYRWCFGLDDVLDTLCHHGPVAIGVNWTQGMLNTNAYGFIYPHGQPVGGHEVELIGIDLDDECVIGANSWGKGWGHGGRFRLAFRDLATLLADQGDAVTLT